MTSLENPTTILFGYCHCGCGHKTDPSKKTKNGILKGQPNRYARGHSGREYTSKYKHDSCDTPTYKSWSAMHYRCSPKHDQAADYHGRGIRVCERWFDYDNFFADMGVRPDGCTIDRIDNDGNYEPSNCQWSTRLQQAQNQRTNHKVTVDGVSRTLSAWSRVYGVHAATIHYRLKRGWTPDNAVKLPRYPQKKGTQ